MSQSFRHRNNGFTLVEVLIAVAILAAGITVVMQSVSFSARTAATAMDTTRAVFLAEDTLQKIAFYEKMRHLSQLPNTFNDKIGKFSFRYTMSPSTALVGVSVLDYSIEWRTKTRLDNFEVLTYLKQ